MADFDSLILDHLNIGVSDLDVSLPIYEAALAPLGLKIFFRRAGRVEDAHDRFRPNSRSPGVLAG